MNNQHLQTLQIIETLSRFDASVKTLADHVKCSEASTKRYIKDARHLGADIVASRKNGAWVYELRNWDACKKTVISWIALTLADTVV